MKGYILAILGVVVVGILVDVVIPSGKINKFIKSIYAVFVVMVILNPIIKLVSNLSSYKFNYNEFQVSSSLLNYINKQKVEGFEKEIVYTLESSGLTQVEVKIDYSLQDDKLVLNFCTINLKNMATLPSFQHNNKYEFIIKVVNEVTNLKPEEIIFDE